MAAERLSVKTIKRFFELRFVAGLSQRQVAKSQGIARRTIQRYEKLAEEKGLTDFSKISSLTESEVLNLLGLESYLPVATPKPKKQLPDWSYVHQELSKKHVTRHLLWSEYKEQHPDGYEKTQFYELYRRWKKTLNISMRQEHKAGEKLFVDYAGTTVPIIDRSTGGVRQAQIFVGVMGASSYTYAEATWSQQLPDWLMSHRRCFEFMGGVPQIVVPDNLRSGVTKANRYESEVNRSYQELAEHYGTCVLPARVRKPQDKAKAEVGVLVVSRWILAALRNKAFSSLEELNDAISVLLEKLNNKPMRHFKKSRFELFESLDKPALGKLRETPHQYSEWKKATVNIDHHIVYEDHFYSCPYQLIKHQVDVRATNATIEIFYRSERVASHRRSYFKGRSTSEDLHRPQAHQEHLKWTPERIINWGRSKGDNTGFFIEHLITSKSHPEQGYRAALGVIRLSDKYGAQRLNQACGKAIAIGAISYRTIKNMLKNEMDKVPPSRNAKDSKQKEFFVSNENIRGKSYYH